MCPKRLCGSRPRRLAPCGVVHRPGEPGSVPTVDLTRTDMRLTNQGGPPVPDRGARGPCHPTTNCPAGRLPERRSGDATPEGTPRSGPAPLVPAVRLLRRPVPCLCCCRCLRWRACPVLPPVPIPHANTGRPGPLPGTCPWGWKPKEGCGLSERARNDAQRLSSAAAILSLCPKNTGKRGKFSLQDFSRFCVQHVIALCCTPREQLRCYFRRSPLNQAHKAGHVL